MANSTYIGEPIILYGTLTDRLNQSINFADVISMTIKVMNKGASECLSYTKLDNQIIQGDSVDSYKLEIATDTLKEGVIIGQIDIVIASSDTISGQARDIEEFEIGKIFKPSC